ncbi:MAG TPA: hypothetical protein VGF28_14305 [Thermoanaerobaculia bacterium]|jgi:hypothetical protein
MSYRINFVGLVNFFDRGTDGKLLLLPDGREPTLNIAPHRASIVVLRSQVRRDLSDWAAEPDDQLAPFLVDRYAISEKATISISGLEPGEAAGTLDTTGWDGKVPLLRQIDETLEIVPENAVVQIPVARGRLEAYSLGNGSTVGQLTVAHEGAVMVTATSRESDVVRTLVLRDGAEIVISNISNPLAPARDPKSEISHFRLYGQLDRHGRSERLETPEKSKLDQIPSAHPYLAFLRTTEGTFPAPECPVTGCCPG